MSSRTRVSRYTRLLAATPGKGQLLDERGLVQDEFSYTRESFPGAVIGALRFTDVSFALKLAARMWIHTDP